MMKDKSWKWKKNLENTKSGEFHYSSVIQAKNKKIHITYTNRLSDIKKTKKHISITEKWVKDNSK